LKPKRFNDLRAVTRWLAPALLPGLVGLACMWAACGRSRGPNVILVTIDTLRADYLGCYGHDRPTSPNIDAFSADAALFEQVLCQSPETLPSHTSIMTGTHPRTNGVISHESKVDAAITTLAEVVSKQGYTAGAIVSSHVLDAKYGLDQGFATYRAVHYAYKENQREAMHQREEDPTTDEALTWLRDHSKTKFFLWVHWFHPHRAYNPPPRYKQLFAGGYAGPAAEDQNDFAMRVWRDRVELPAEDVAYMRGLYDGEVAFTDAQVGRLLDELKALGLLDNTVVVITSDHGEILYEHEYYFGHDIALYDECTMIPLLVRIPGLGAPARRIGGLVQSIDIFPTVLEALGISCPAGVEGKSLLPLLRGSADRTVEHGFTETFPFPEKCPPRHAVRTETAKMVWREEPPAEMVKQLYDLKADPAETANLYPAGPQAAALDAILADWIAPKGLHPAPIPTAAESGRLKILKSLGYVD
jgi:arylsulfatase